MSVENSKILNLSPKWRVKLTVLQILFSPVPEEIAYSFSNFLFDLLELYKFGLWVSQLGNDDLVSDYIFTSQKKSQSIPDMVFLLTLNYPQLLEGVAGKEWVTLLKEKFQFSHKSKLKSEIFNYKKSL